MSLLFNNEYGAEQGNKRQYSSEQRNVNRLHRGIKRSWDQENLLVFGYACSLYNDEEKARFFDEGKHLIARMGDENLLIDRYDGRLLLEDLSQFTRKDGCVNNELSEEELEIERQCEEERYLALNKNVSLNMQEEEEDEMKRFKEAIASDDSYAAVGYKYEEHHPSGSQPTTSQTQSYSHNYSEKPSEIQTEPEIGNSNVPEIEEVEVFEAPEALGVPKGMPVPNTAKLHAIIEKTAMFIKDHGPQMEIVLKAKQSGNQQFDFLHFDDELNPYYKLILKAVRDGTYEISSSKPPSPEVEESEDDESDEDIELHPLLTASLKTPVTIAKNNHPEVLPPGWTQVNADAANNVNTVPNTATMHPNSFGMVQELPPPPPPPFPIEIMTSLNADIQPENFYPPSLSYPLSDPYSMDQAAMIGGSAAPATMARPIIPPPPDLKPICDKLADYVARNGQQFEENIKAKGDPRFDFLHETSDHYTYYHMKREEFKRNPQTSDDADATVTDQTGGGALVPNDKPVSFQIKAKKGSERVIKYRSSVLFQNAKADESDEDEDGINSEDDKEPVNIEGIGEHNVAGPKTQEDIIAEERATKLKQEKEREVQRLDEEAKSTTSSLRRQVQLERRRRAQLFINMLKKTNTESTQPSSTPNKVDMKNIFESPAPS